MKLLLNADFVPMTYEDAHFEALVIDDEGTIAFTGDLDRARAGTPEPRRSTWAARPSPLVSSTRTATL